MGTRITCKRDVHTCAERLGAVSLNCEDEFVLDLITTRLPLN